MNITWTILEAEETCGNTRLGTVFLVTDGPRVVTRLTERKDAEVLLALIENYQIKKT